VNVKGERIRSMADNWRDVFGRVTNIYRGDNSRVPGWRLMREMLDWTERPDGGVLMPPRLLVYNICSNLVRTLPKAICDTKNPEDIDTDGEDHAIDAARYGLTHAFEGSGRGGLGARVYISPQGLVVKAR